MAVTSFAFPDETNMQASAPSAAVPRSAERAAAMLRRRNRLLALTLAVVAGSVFALVLCLVVMFHYLQAHHVVPTWI